jgi:hypothetical protein
MTTATAPFEIDVEALQALPPEVREEELAKVAILKAAMESNPLFRFVPHLGELGWKLREQEKVREGWSVDGWELLDELRARNPDESRGQVEFHEIARPHGAFVGGNQSGKTTVGCADSLIQTLPLELFLLAASVQALGVRRAVFLPGGRASIWATGWTRRCCRRSGRWCRRRRCGRASSTRRTRSGPGSCSSRTGRGGTS